jgi:hypothetical protein
VPVVVAVMKINDIYWSSKGPGDGESVTFSGCRRQPVNNSNTDFSANTTRFDI